MSAPVRVATRGSALALAQARLAVAALEATGVTATLVTVQTAGDVRAPDTAWGEGAFVGALEQALLRGDADVAVHSAKDMPTDEDSRLSVVAYLPRADARDALVVAARGDGEARSDGPAPPMSGVSAAVPAITLDDLPAGAVVGTDSPRRGGFVRARRPDLVIRPIHGNVDTRLRRLDEGAADALVLACAGLDRLGRSDRISQRLDVADVPPAPGQGAIALQARASDERLATLGAAIDDRPTRIAVETERTLLGATGGGCRAPVGAFAVVDDDELTLVAGFATIDGRASGVERRAGRRDDARALARDVAEALVARRAASAIGGRVLVTRPETDSDKLVARLAEHGLRGIVVPAIAVTVRDAAPELDAALARLGEYRWLVVTSANGARAVLAAGQRTGVDTLTAPWAAVGRGTAAALGDAAGAAWLPTTATAAALGVELPIARGDRVLLVRGSLADAALLDALARRGAQVDEVIGYDTVPAPPTSRGLLAEALAEGIDAIVLASPSAVRGLVALLDAPDIDAVLGVPAVCVGPSTAGAARQAGFRRVLESTSPDAGVVAELAATGVAEPLLETRR